MLYQTGLLNSKGEFYAPCYWHIPPNWDKAITVKEAAETYNYSVNALVAKIKRNQIYGFKLNYRWYLLPYGLKQR